jgi:hypothetical protein
MDINESTASQAPIESHVFTFGDPEPVLRDNLIDYLGVFQDLTGPFYVPPVDLRGLSRLRRANPHHDFDVVPGIAVFVP